MHIIIENEYVKKYEKFVFLGEYIANKMEREKIELKTQVRKYWSDARINLLYFVYVFFIYYEIIWVANAHLLIEGYGNINLI